MRLESIRAHDVCTAAKSTVQQISDGSITTRQNQRQDIMRTWGSTSVTQKFDPHPSSPRGPFEGVPRKLAEEVRRPFNRTSGVGGICSLSTPLFSDDRASCFVVVGVDGVAGAADIARVIWARGECGYPVQVATRGVPFQAVYPNPRATEMKRVQTRASRGILGIIQAVFRGG